MSKVPEEPVFSARLGSVKMDPGQLVFFASKKNKRIINIFRILLLFYAIILIINKVCLT